METTKNRYRTTALYWNQTGRIECEEHAPYRGSDTWVNEHYQRITPSDIKEADAIGMTLQCECCGVQVSRIMA